MEFVARTHTGNRRDENQDSACAFMHAGFTIGIVADGMGGHNGGSTASRMALEGVKAHLLKTLTPQADVNAIRKILRAAYSEVNRSIFELAKQEKTLEGMGTTLTVAVLREDKLLVAHIGDSRAYTHKTQTLTQVTADQTLIHHLLESGLITPQEAKTHPHRHMILEAVGTEELIVPEFYEVSLDGHTVMLCSDGLTGELEDEQIGSLLSQKNSLATMADSLISQANAAGGQDNISVVLLR